MKMDNIKDKPFFIAEGVGESWKEAIEIRFNALIEQRREKLWEWYQKIGLDKADASRIKRGLIIPNQAWKIKIAQYFGVDSTTIWKVPDRMEEKLERQNNLSEEEK